MGAFLLALAALSKLYMYDSLAVVPANNQSTSISSTAPGDDAEYLDVAAGLKVTTGPLKSTRIVAGDVKKSKQASKDLDRDITVWDTYKCTDKPEFKCGGGKTPLSGTTDTVAFDRNTGETVSWKGTKSESGGKTITPADFKGQYFKFPFNTQKKTYQFWDETLRKSTAAKYVGEGKVKGLKVYKFEQTIAPTKSGTIDVPGDLVDSKEATVTADRIYSNVRTFSVEPVTGVIVIGGEDQDAYLEVDGERKLTTTKAKLVYTDKNTTDVVDKYKSKATVLGAVKNTVPLVGGILGLLLIALGALTKFGGKSDAAGSRKAGSLRDAPRK
ncbi:MAG: DUF3068 domain-containing protein [Actinomycetota bacterium]|nr:DUF3068 domain-containing protein [Actinomycetota bacterium]